MSEAAENKTVTIALSGRIDSGNAQEVEDMIRARLEGNENAAIVLDARDLVYTSSAGLRVLLRLKKTNPDLKIINVNADVYEILQTTGFTEMLTVEKAYRQVSVEGCEVIGRGANGTVYRIDQDNVVKVYHDPSSLSEIQNEREVARLALILGIPTAISYDVVQVGDTYGSVFELLNAAAFAQVIKDHPEKFDWCVKEYVDLLKLIHGTVVPEGKLPDVKDTVIKWAAFMQDHLPEEAGKKLMALVNDVPYDNHMIHGDYHTKNVVVQGDEVLLIDMDTLSTGHPVFELASMFNSFIGYSEYNHDTIIDFQGYDYETGKKFWHESLKGYLGTDDEEKITEVENKARIVGYTRMIRRSIRRKGLETEEGRAEIELWKGELLDLLEKTDTLLF